MKRYTTVEGLARTVLEELRSGDWLSHAGDALPDAAIECVANTLVGDPERAKAQGIPDRQPDFVVWAQHGEGDQAGTSAIACLPGNVAGPADWCAASAFFLHHAALLLAQDQGRLYDEAMQELIQKALEQGE